MIGIGGAIKAIAALVIVVIVAGALWYVTNLRAQLAISENNNEKLEQAVKDQQDLIDSIKRDVEQIQTINNQLQEQNEKQKKDVQALTDKFSGGNRDFGAFAAAKPQVVEKLVNRGTVNALRCIELASGAPLNEKEKNAKTPTEANRECPSLIDSDFSAIVN